MAFSTIPQKSAHSLPAATQLGSVHLNVADLKSQIAFYTGIIGLSLLSENDGSASLGAGGRELLRLTQKAGAKTYEHKTGLYHFCLLTPERMELGRLLRRILDSGTPIQGLVDHHVAEAIYLPDTEGNGIELNWDRPRSVWEKAMSLMSRGNGPLDAEGLLALADKAGPGTGILPHNATLSHMHLHVKDLDGSRAFYHEQLGLDIMGEFPRQAVFTSAGGYHHHVAFNIWNGVGAAEPPADATGLNWFSVVLPDQKSLDEVLGWMREAGIQAEKKPEGWLLRDPSGNGVMLTL